MAKTKPKNLEEWLKGCKAMFDYWDVPHEELADFAREVAGATCKAVKITGRNQNKPRQSLFKDIDEISYLIGHGDGFRSGVNVNDNKIEDWLG